VSMVSAGQELENGWGLLGRMQARCCRRCEAEVTAG
jgi:hypothetical protein